MRAVKLQRDPHSPFFAEGDKAKFQQDFQKACFQFSHYLTDHPLFRTDALLAQAERQPDTVFFDVGEIKVDHRWDAGAARPMTAADAIRNIHGAKAWVLLKNAERNPDYAQVADRCLAEVEELTGQPIVDKVSNRILTIVMTSPNRVTPYHIDGEANFLMQLVGNKTVHTFDGRDRSILSEEELEHFFAVDTNAARYKSSHQAKATSFAVRPGDGIHIPLAFPHWVKNDDNVSVSVSINFQLPEIVRAANAYRANFYLRQRGLHPSPVGKSRAGDSVKAAAYARLRNALHLEGK